MKSRPFRLALLLLLLTSVSAWWFSSCAEGPADLARTLARESRRQEALKTRLEMSRRCSEGKRRVVAEVIAGRLTLLQAADEFARLQALLEDGNEALLGTVPVPRERQALCRHVLDRVEEALEQDPARAAVVVARLQEEYRRNFPQRSVSFNA